MSTECGARNEYFAVLIIKLSFIILLLLIATGIFAQPPVARYMDEWRDGTWQPAGVRYTYVYVQGTGIGFTFNIESDPAYKKLAVTFNQGPPQ